MPIKKSIIIAIISAFVVAAGPGPIRAQIPEEEAAKIRDAMPAKPVVKPEKPRKLLVFSLCKGFRHGAVPYGAYMLKAMGEKTGAFEATESMDPEVFRPENLKQYDAVCFNNSTGQLFEDPELKQSLMDFVKGGGGVVGIHAATDCFYEWEEYGKMIGGYFHGHPWGAGDTVTVRIDDSLHELTKVFEGKSFEIQDEIYQFRDPYSRENLRVLLTLDPRKTNMEKGGIHRTDNDFAVAWVQSWGKGRVFYCSLGHNPHVFWTPDVLQFYLAGTQYALGDLDADATPSAELSDSYREKARLQSLEQDLEGRREGLNDDVAFLPTYEFGQSREPLTRIAEYVRDSASFPERRDEIVGELLAILESGKASRAAVDFICRRFAVAGGEEEVPALARLLQDPETADMGRYALERIPDSAAGQALRDALETTGGEVLIGVVNSLGERRDEEAVGKLSELLDAPDAEVASAAATALGRISGRKATSALLDALEQAEGDVLRSVETALVEDARLYLDDESEGGAERIFDALDKADPPMPVRLAILAGRARIGGGDGLEAVLAALRGSDAKLQASALRHVRDIDARGATESFIKLLDEVEPDLEASLLRALADRGDAAAHDAAAQRVHRDSEAVRVAAFYALTQLGAVQDIRMLAEHAASTEGAEQAGARKALERITGNGVHSELVALMTDAEQPDVRAEAARALGQRDATDAVANLLEAVGAESDASVREEILKALAITAPPSDLSAVAQRVVAAEEDAERSEARAAVLAVARRTEEEKDRVRPIEAVYREAEPVAALAELLSIMGELGDPGFLDTLTGALTADNEEVRTAAVRALAQDWPTDEPADRLLRVAESSEDEVAATLALRGYIRMAAMSGDRPAEETFKMLDRAFALASAAAERGSVLKALESVRTPRALALAADSLDDEALRAEAVRAVIAIAAETQKTAPSETRTALERVLEIDAEQADAVAPIMMEIEKFDDYIQDWQVAGPYAADGATGTDLFDEAFAPEQGEAEWRALDPDALPADAAWQVNVAKAVGAEGPIAYLSTWVRVPTEMEAVLQVGSDDGIKAWVNDNVAISQNVSRGIAPGQDSAKVALNAGWNRLMLKVSNNAGGWAACARFRAVDGSAIDGLEISAAKP